tara:strand:- start:4659 stop:6617 length:1959 start_codon:yes stop_codon:yes gene_type:complete
MSNGMYDDGGVKFAEEQFAQARARDDEENKRKEKFAKKLSLVNTAIKGVNFGLNLLADELDAKQVPQKTAYMNFLQSANARRKLLEPYSVADDKLKYVEDYIYGQSISDLAKRFPTIDPISYENYARDYAKNQAPLLAPEFEKMFTELQDIPDQATFETEYSKYQGRTNPRGIFGNVVKLIRNTFKKEDEESLAIKNAKAKDAIYGSPMFNEIVGAREAVEAFESKFQTGGSELIESILQAKKEGKLRGKYDISKATFIDKPIGYKEDGSPITKKVAVVAGIGVDGAPSILELETGTATQSPKNVPIIYDWDDKTYLENTASLVLASFDKESNKLYKKYSNTDSKLMKGLVSRIVQKAENYANTGIYDKQTATLKAVKDFVAAHKDVDSFLDIPTNVTQAEIEKDSPVSLIIDTLRAEADSNNMDDTNIRQSTIDDAIAYIKGNIDTSITINAADTLDNIILLADYIVKNQYISEDEKVEYIEGINNTIMTQFPDGTPLLDINKFREPTTDGSDEINLNEMQTWEESGNVATVFVQGEPSRKYLNNFDSVVNKLDLSNLSLEELRYLTNIDENLLRNLLGMPKELEFEENPFSIDTRLDEVVKKYRRNNFKKLYDDLKRRNPNLSDSELKKESFKKQPSLEFFEKLRNQLLS